MPKKQKTVFAGMSGGVDSSVAAYLLKKKGYRVIGVFMRCYNVDGCAEQDAEDARRTAEKLGIPFYVWDFEEEYKKRVVDYMVRGYRRGITPNPDVVCNREIKFGLFLEKALKMGADYAATGHYVRKKEHRTRNLEHGKRNTPLSSKFQVLNSLYAAKDKNKDQSYFLWTLTQKELRHCLFPIGGLTKPQVRAIARRAGLPTAEKKDSQGICFLGQVSLSDFLSAYIPARRGLILSPSGEILGEHQGAAFLTVGQRHIGANFQFPISPPKADPPPADNFQNKQKRERRYVVSKNMRANTVTIAEGRDNPLLFKKEIRLTEVNFISPLRTTHHALRTGLPVLARVRYRQPLAPARLYSLLATNCKLVFDFPQQFVAEGQSAVWYSRKGEMLGGGVIVSAA